MQSEYNIQLKPSFEPNTDVIQSRLSTELDTLNMRLPMSHYGRPT